MPIFQVLFSDVVKYIFTFFFYISIKCLHSQGRYQKSIVFVSVLKFGYQKGSNISSNTEAFHQFTIDVRRFSFKNDSLFIKKKKKDN